MEFTTLLVTVEFIYYEIIRRRRNKADTVTNSSVYLVSKL